MELFKRFSRIILILVLCMGSISARPMSTDTVTLLVDTTVDEYNNTPNSTCSLREAVESAVHGHGFGGCVYSGSGLVEITLPDNTYILNACPAGDSYSCGDIDVRANITIYGGGRDSTVIDAEYHDRIFEVGNTYNLTLNDLTLTHGKAFDGRDGDPGIGDVPDQDGGAADNGWQGEGGGAIYAQNGISLTLNRVAVIDNASGDGGNGGQGGNGGNRTTPGTGHAGGKGGNGGQSGSGGAINSYNATVTITDCIFSGNHTGLGGDGGTGGNGGAGMASSPSELGAGGNGGDGGTGSYIGSGGAIYAYNGLLTITRSVFHDNYAPAAGNGGAGGSGAAGQNGSITTNYSAGDGGAGGKGGNGGSGPYGGAIYAYTSAIIVDSIYYNNSAGSGGLGGSGGTAGVGGDGADMDVVIADGNKGGAGGKGGTGGAGSYGGYGGAISTYHALSISGSSIYNNFVGSGSNGGNGMTGGTGGSGGASPNISPGGDGGQAGAGGNGGYGGYGGGIRIYYGPFTLKDSVVYGNHTNPGGTGGYGGTGGVGGAGGDSTSPDHNGGTGGVGGAGGNAGLSRYGGYGGGLQYGITGAGPLTITNTTISGNSSGAAPDGADGGDGGMGGAGGNSLTTSANGGVGGAGGNGSNGSQSGVGGGAVFNLYTGDPASSLSFLTVALNSVPDAPGIGGTGGTGGMGGQGSDGSKALQGVDGTSGSNGSTGSGGGLAISGGGTLNLQNSILAGNHSPGGVDCLGSILSQDYNLIGTTSYCIITFAGHDLYDGTASPLNLAALADNGGNTLTHALQSGSVAMDRIPSGTNGCGSPYSKDQRRFYRPADGDSNGTSSCDIGAFEYGSDLLGVFSWLPLIKKP